MRRQRQNTPAGKGFKADQRELDSVWGDLRRKRVYDFDRELGLNGTTYDEVPENPGDWQDYTKAYCVYEAFRDGRITARTRDSLLASLHKPDYLLAQQGREKLYGQARLQEELEALDRQAIEAGNFNPGNELYSAERQGLFSTFATPMEGFVDATEGRLYPGSKPQWDVRHNLNLMGDYFGDFETH